MHNKFQWPTMFSGLKGATWANLPNEISAGITLAALIIPLNIGYAQVAGLPPVFGLYAGIIPLAIFALFTGSRHVVPSPDASSSAIVGAILIGFAAQETRCGCSMPWHLPSGKIGCIPPTAMPSRPFAGRRGKRHRKRQHSQIRNVIKEISYG